MSEKIVVPVLGESITEATVAKWLKKTGDAVEADEPIVELETDKVNLEVPSPITGVLTEINSQGGSTVEVGALLGSVSENGSAKVKRIHLERPVEGLDMLNGRLCDRRSQYQMHMERLAVTDLTAFKILAPVGRKIL